MSRSIIVGDIHGCLDELLDLLYACDYQEGDNLVFVGDLIDRGPDSLGVVRKAQELRAKCVMGNHEEKHIRYRKHERKKLLDPSYKNPMFKFDEQRLREHLSYSDYDIDWMAAFPKYLWVTSDLVAIHAGMQPGKPVEKQPENNLLRMRYMDDEGQMMPLQKDRGKPEEGTFWTKKYDGKVNVVYGHNVDNYENPRVDTGPEGVKCIGLDTGCCFGGYLTALIWPGTKGAELEFVQVNASREYYPRWRDVPEAQLDERAASTR